MCLFGCKHFFSVWKIILKVTFVTFYSSICSHYASKFSYCSALFPDINETNPFLCVRVIFISSDALQSSNKNIKYAPIHKHSLMCHHSSYTMVQNIFNMSCSSHRRLNLCTQDQEISPSYGSTLQLICDFKVLSNLSLSAILM